MDFYVGQMVRVKDVCDCGDIWDENYDEDYMWSHLMEAFCLHEYEIIEIDENGHIWLNETDESEEIYANDGSGVGDYYFCKYWLDPITNEVFDTAAIDAMFDEMEVL